MYYYKQVMKTLQMLQDVVIAERKMDWSINVEYVEELYEQLKKKYQPPSKPEYPMNGYKQYMLKR